MRVDVALLCDFCTVRENLLHILGGGVTNITRPTYPSPMGMGLALRVLAHPTEVAAPHVIRVVVLGQDGQEVAVLQIDTPVITHLPMANEDVPLNVPFALHGVILPTANNYSVEILIDNLHQKSVPFVARAIEETQ